MRAKVLSSMAVLAILALSVAGCGGGGDSSGAPAATTTSGVSQGVITKMGSVVIRGVEFNTDNATITMDETSDAPILKPGMVVTVKGEFDDATHGRASEVKFADKLRGPVSSFNNLSSSMTVLDQKIKFVPARTVFDNFSGSPASRAITLGQMVQVSGFTDVTGTIQATFIERKLPNWTPSTTVEIKGKIGAPMTATTFKIGLLTVDFTGITLPTGATVGTAVKVKGTIPTLASTTFFATSIVAYAEGIHGEGSEGSHLEIEGFVSGFTGGNTFMVGDTPVNTGTLSLAGIANGVMAEVEGKLSGGVLVAKEINVEEIPHAIDFFSQDDLTGTWNFMIFVAGPDVTTGTEPGWIRGKMSIDGSGKVTVASIASSSNLVTLPPPGTVTEMIDANGIVTEGGINGAGVGNHAVMAANKQIIVGTSTIGNGNRAIRIFIKQVPGVTFSNIDLANTSFSFHELHSGSDSIWAYGTGAVDGSLQRTFTSAVIPSGPVGLPPAATASISSDGIVTGSDNATFQGIMTPDKKAVFGTASQGGYFVLRIFQVTGQIFSQADMAGTWRTHGIGSSSTAPEWDYTTISFTNAGVGTITALTSSSGSTMPPSPPNNTVTYNLAAAGTLTQNNAPTLHGTVSSNKDLAVLTKTGDLGIYRMTIVLK